MFIPKLNSGKNLYFTYSLHRWQELLLTNKQFSSPLSTSHPLIYEYM